MLQDMVHTDGIEARTQIPGIYLKQSNFKPVVVKYGAHTSL
jgi:hypothetical protein